MQTNDVVTVDNKVILTFKEDGRTVHTPGSNFWMDDAWSVEIEFQARKHDGHPFRQKMIRACGDSWKAKKLGRKWRLDPTELKRWDRDKKKIMRNCLREKAARNKVFVEWLLSTGDMTIEEVNWWHDQEWGSCSCDQHFYRRGQN